MDMEIVYYEQDGGVLQKVAEFPVQTRNGASLDQICREALQKVNLRERERERERVYVCLHSVDLHYGQCQSIVHCL